MFSASRFSAQLHVVQPDVIDVVAPFYGEFRSYKVERLAFSGAASLKRGVRHVQSTFLSTFIGGRRGVFERRIWPCDNFSSTQGVGVRLIHDIDRDERLEQSTWIKLGSGRRTLCH